MSEKLPQDIPNGEQSDSPDMTAQFRDVVERLTSYEAPIPFGMTRKLTAASPDSDLVFLLHKGTPPGTIDSTGAKLPSRSNRLVIDLPDVNEATYPLPDNPQISEVFTTQSLSVQDGILTVRTHKGMHNPAGRVTSMWNRDRKKKMIEESPLGRVLSRTAVDTYDASGPELVIARSLENEVVAMVKPLSPLFTELYKDTETQGVGPEDVSESVPEETLRFMLSSLQSAAKATEDLGLWSAVPQGPIS